jgi:hypothetical protein
MPAKTGILFCLMPPSEAHKYTEVSDLPPKLTPNSYTEWRRVAKKMLAAHWEAHPAEKKADFERVKISANSAGESPEAFAHGQKRGVGGCTTGDKEVVLELIGRVG